MNSDSGVVMRMCGGCFAISVRSRCGVSPVRTATRISGSGVPCASASPAMPSCGTDRLRCTSFESAFSGETYTTSVRSGSPPSSPARTSRSMHVRNAASVLPDPVGAAISVCRPFAMASQPSACAPVGPVNCPKNHSRTSG